MHICPPKRSKGSSKVSHKWLDTRAHWNKQQNQVPQPKNDNNGWYNNKAIAIRELLDLCRVIIAKFRNIAKF